MLETIEEIQSAMEGAKFSKFCRGWRFPPQRGRKATELLERKSFPFARGCEPLCPTYIDYFLPPSTLRGLKAMGEVLLALSR